ncbi:MAG: hypothetical protein ACE5SW_11300 [Nitrososphaeraceae archaeon]
MNSQIKIGSMFLLAAVLVAGTISMTIPSSFAQPYAPDPYADPYAMEKPHPKSVNVQKINCHNSNTNINGVDVNQLPPQNGDAATAQLQEDGTANGNGNGNGLLDSGINLEKNLVNICVDVNLNGQFSGDRLPVILD